MKRKYIRAIATLVAVLVVNSGVSTLAISNSSEVILESKNSLAINEEQTMPWTPIVKYDVNKEFNGTKDFIDVSGDINNIQDLSQGTLAVKFKTSENKEQTLFTISDKNDARSYFEVKLVGGNLRLEIYENGTNVFSYVTSGKNFNNGNYHTAIISGGEDGGKLYVDGELLINFPTHKDKFISLVKTPNSMVIGKKVTNSGDSLFFKGEIRYIEIFNEQFSNDDSLRYSKNDYRDIINIIHGENDANVVFTGDSITHGIQHANGYRSYSEHFNERLRGETVSGKSKKESFVVNTGVSSADSSWALNTYESWIGTYDAKVVFITFGMNDCSNRLTLDKYKETITELVRRVREDGGIPILQTSNLSKPNGGRETQILPYMMALRELSKTLDVFLVDHRAYWESSIPESDRQNNPWLNDAIHPNKQGHLEMAKLIFRELKLDTEESYTSNLAYPIVVNDNAKSVNESMNYPEYIKVDEIEPIVSYDVNRYFYGRDFIDKTYDIDKVKDIESGSIVAKFNITSSGAANTILSLSDNTNASKEFAVGVNAGGKIFINGRADTANHSVTINNGSYNDGKWHTLVVSSDESGLKVYVDGTNIHSNGTNLFLSSLKKPTNLSIGRNVHDAGGEWFYNGGISYVEIFNKPLTEEQITSISPIEKANSDFDSIKELMLQNGVPNSWVLLGDNSTAGNGSTYGHKNYGEYFEERIRWELRGAGDINRQRYVVNSGVDGATSTDILSNFDSWVTEFDPELVSIMIGGQETVTPEKFEENLRAILAKVSEIGAVPMLQTPVIQNGDVSEYVNRILKISKELDMPVVDHYKKWNDLYKAQPHLKESWLNENLDPNHRGHLQIAKDMMTALGIYDSNSISGGKYIDVQYPGDTQGVEELKNNLSTLINKANDLISSLVEGCFDVNAKNNLVEDIAASKREISKTNSTVATVNNTINFLTKSIDGLEKTIIAVEIEDINKDGVINIGDLAIISKYYGKDSSFESWESIKYADVNRDGIINDKDIDIVAIKMLQ